jgi:hypothetical protein
LDYRLFWIIDYLGLGVDIIASVNKKPENPKTFKREEEFKCGPPPATQEY